MWGTGNLPGWRHTPRNKPGDRARRLRARVPRRSGGRGAGSGLPQSLASSRAMISSSASASSALSRPSRNAASLKKREMRASALRC